jgi:hypothetical protein
MGWTPLSYAKAHGKYGPTEEAGIYPEVRYEQQGLFWGLKRVSQPAAAAQAGIYPEVHSSGFCDATSRLSGYT